MRATFLCSVIVVITLLATSAWSPKVVLPPATNRDYFAYENIPADHDYPAAENVLLGFRDAVDVKAMRRHAWNLWAGLTAPSKSSWKGQTLPIFETWYSIPEVFEKPYLEQQPASKERPFHRAFEIPHQVIHARDRFGGSSPAQLSFVKFNQAAANFIWENKYHLRSTLDSLNERHDAQKTPIEQREIKPFPREAVALKLVYWLVKQADSPQSQNGLTAMPYWDPDYPAPKDGRPPMHLTWTKCVAVDPAGKYPKSSQQKVTCNGKDVVAEVMGLDRFYSYQLRDPSEVERARLFMKHLSVAKEQERFVTDPAQVPELNDFVILLAMHVTTKELDDWTFQTFWWSPKPDAAPHGLDRPASVHGVWANYQMCTAYSMDTPKTGSGGPPICFNPYLETDLGPTKPFMLAGNHYSADPMAGTRSNCMTCHRRAGWPEAKSNYGRVFNEGFLDRRDPYFAGITTTDFLWSIVLQAQPKKK